MSQRPPSFSELVVQRWRPLLGLTGLALAVFFTFRLLPTGTNLSHTDFRPDGNSIEMCDPSNPQFLPVVTLRSPVTMSLPPTSGTVGAPFNATLGLVTASGRPIGPEDLAVVHTQKLHLLLIDPTLQDYQHVHPVPGKKPGEWTFRFTPRKPGVYRVFGDFTPLATGRGLYGHVDLPVEPGGQEAPLAHGNEGLAVRLELPGGQVREGKVADLALTLADDQGAPLLLGPIMGAYAHLVAFDGQRLGFAHLHPMEQTEPRPEGARIGKLRFQVTFPKAGDYVVWAQVNLEGRERFFRFPLLVAK